MIIIAAVIGIWVFGSALWRGSNADRIGKTMFWIVVALLALRFLLAIQGTLN